jgi:spore germination cell wall hydrolase CwlJ-like protein
MSATPQPALDRGVDVLARTVYGEARGESDLGRLAVAYVPCNRAGIAARFVAARGYKHPLYGDGSVASACQAPWQFSCWNERDPNRAKLLALDLGSEAAAPSLWAANAAIQRSAPDPSNGGTNYHTAMAPRDGIDWPPSWAVGQKIVATVGAHVFYRLG